jgi:hypothetical protein
LSTGQTITPLALAEESEAPNGVLVSGAWSANSSTREYVDSSVHPASISQGAIYPIGCFFRR